MDATLTISETAAKSGVVVTHHSEHLYAVLNLKGQHLGFVQGPAGDGRCMVSTLGGGWDGVDSQTFEAGVDRIVQVARRKRLLNADRYRVEAATDRWAADRRALAVKVAKAEAEIAAARLAMANYYDL